MVDLKKEIKAVLCSIIYLFCLHFRFVYVLVIQMQ